MALRPDPKQPITCPTCGHRLAYVRMDDEMHVYWCLPHGGIVLSPAGRFRLEIPTEIQR
jgi:hypothetical protein